jgi:DNA-binding NtrC family response regulator
MPLTELQGECRGILVVDDEEVIREATRDYLASHGYAVDCAREREEAEAMIARHDYTLVIADMRLTGAHGREGLELITLLRECRPQARAIILTAYASPELERESLRRGAALFLEKPVPLSELAAHAARLLAEVG